MGAWGGDGGWKEDLRGGRRGGNLPLSAVIRVIFPHFWASKGRGALGIPLGWGAGTPPRRSQVWGEGG